MKAATVKELKIELEEQSHKELVELCLRMAKFKLETKEFLTYLLYEASDEDAFIRSVKMEIDNQLEEVNTTRYYFINKSVRKILRNINKHIRYSKKKETKVELKLYYCYKIKQLSAFPRNHTLVKIFNREIVTIRKTISTLHEDLQYDYEMELEELKKGT